MNGNACDFGAESTIDEVLEGIELSGKRVLVTGVSAGLGAETARALVGRGAHVVGTARDLAKAIAVSANFVGPGKFSAMSCDLASLESVRACADKLTDIGSFDAVIANAGVLGTAQRAMTVDGFELHFGTNHLGHFLLVNRIAPLITSGGRLITVSAAGHCYADVDLDDPGFEKADYSLLSAYGRSKTANILFAVEFDKRHRGRGVRAASVHPGGINTQLVRNLGESDVIALMSALKVSEDGGAPIVMKSPAQGAATTAWAGFRARADEVGGKYCEDCQVAAPSVSRHLLAGYEAYALDPERAAALWAKSEEMVGESFAPPS